MSFLHTRSKQLAEHLRGCLERGELTEPLPGMRAWRDSLGVSLTTLQSALKILEREGFLIIQPCKAIRLRTRRKPSTKIKSGPQAILRVLYYGRDYPNLALMELPGLSEHLRTHRIGISLERCTHARLKAISQKPLPAHELLFLCSVPAAFHRYFAHMTRNVLITGHPCPGSPLSYITVDLESAVRHASQSLIRRGFSVLSLLINHGKSQGIVKTIQVFHKTCADWPHQPIHANTIQMHADLDSMTLSAQRFVAHVKPRQAVLVVEPISVSLIMTLLLGRGFAIPRDVEIIAFDTSTDSIKVHPRPIHYPYPVRATVKSFADAALHFFETGALPRLRKAIPMEMIPVPG